jgi:hypothetical protein
MSYRIWRYPLEITDRQVLRMPVGAQGLSVLVEEGELSLYAFVDNNVREDDMIIRIVGTGNPTKALSDFIGTVSMPPFVWHVFKE